MSAIGDYVHYTAEGYKKYGIAQAPEKNTVINTEAALNYNINKKMHSSNLDTKQLDQLQRAAEMVLSSKDNSNNEIINKIRMAAEEKLYETYEDTLGKINFATGNISTNRVQKSKNNMLTKLQFSANQDKIYLSTILNRLKSLENARDLITEEKTKDSLHQRINELYRELNGILLEGKKVGVITDLKAAANNLQLLYNNTKLDPFKVLDKNEQIDTLITHINSAIRTFAATPAINLQKGDLLEYIGALLPYLVENKTNASIEEMKKTIEKDVVGTSARSKITIDLGKFSKDLNLSSLGLKNYYITNGANKAAISFGTSQEKIDINMNWQNEIVPISAKNVNLKSSSEIHIVSGSSLLYLIQDEDPNFMTHYLNIVAQHGTIENGESIDNTTFIGSDYQMVHDTMKKILLFKALTGETYGRKGAEVFFVNDNSRPGGVRLYDMNVLLNKAFTNINAYATITANGKNLESLSIPNNWESTYSQRLTNYIARVHDQKISAGLKSNLLE